MELEELNNEQLRLKLKETRRQLNIKTLALASTKNEYHAYKKRVKAGNKAAIDLSKKLQEVLRYGSD